MLILMMKVTIFHITLSTRAIHKLTVCKQPLLLLTVAFLAILILLRLQDVPRRLTRVRLGQCRHKLKLMLVAYKLQRGLYLCEDQELAVA